jgi:vacuolar-type H+-ATPase subunit I/STV1
MSTFTLQYQHNTEPHRGLAVSGIFLIKALLILPHAIITAILNQLAAILAYFGYWVVAFTGKMPQAVHRFAEISFGWNARMWAWQAGIVDLYPPFETDPDYPASFPLARPENPSKGWAVAGIFFLKFIVALPHIIVMALLAVGAIVTMWFGYIVAAFTGRLPTGIQDFMAGVIQWNFRVYAWLAGFTDEYPPFSLEAAPSAQVPDGFGTQEGTGF